MEKHFIPYEQAKEIKQLGFTEDCLGCYSYDMGHTNLSIGKYKFEQMQGGYFTLAPTWEQAFDWFREKGFDNGISLDEHKSYCFEIWNFETKSSYYDYGYINYKEAREACLEKLIELCKKN